jgi:hypothetical protein
MWCLRLVIYLEGWREMQIIIDGNIKEITPEIVALLFCEMDAKGQAIFFNHVDSLASVWSAPLCFQIQAITDEHGLTLGGRRVMQMIGDYSHWGLVPRGNSYEPTYTII